MIMPGLRNVYGRYKDAAMTASKIPFLKAMEE
jgi:hypothetical protein